MASVRLVFPHQLFTDHYKADGRTHFVLVEDDLFFRQFKFHKQKLILHRASMRRFDSELQKRGYTTSYIATGSKASMALLTECLRQKSLLSVSFYDLVDDWLEQRLDEVLHNIDARTERLASPGFLLNRADIETYFDDHPNRMQHFYEWQRRRLDVLMDGNEPIGGQWSFDADNRKPLPKDIALPKPFAHRNVEEASAAIDWVEQDFADNPGKSDTFTYPTTHQQAANQLDDFLQNRFVQFGPYEDAIARNESQLFHSVLSPLINIGLLTPRQVLDEALAYAGEHDVPISSVEGFVRQLIGWREYMRATYQQYGRSMRSQNHLELSRPIDETWWTGKTGLLPVDTTINRILDTAYAHHIERLMILGNSMLLLRFDPDQVYEWFMSLFIDAYDWVMVPNVYAMSQFAAGNKITTKPYISGSNYLKKMSDYPKGEWTDVWDALYWRFVADHKSLFAANPRSNMMVHLYDKLSLARKQAVTKLSNEWL